MEMRGERGISAFPALGFVVVMGIPSALDAPPYTATVYDNKSL